MNEAQGSEGRGRQVVIAAVLGGIALAVGGSYLILSSSGLGPSAGKAGPSGSANFPADASGKLDLETANRSCTTNADCVLVDPMACGACPCASVAVAASEAERVKASAAAVQCPAAEGQAECGACAPASAGCLDGVCTVMP